MFGTHRLLEFQKNVIMNRQGKPQLKRSEWTILLCLRRSETSKKKCNLTLS
jgi:hypothetical protein